MIIKEFILGHARLPGKRHYKNHVILPLPVMNKQHYIYRASLSLCGLFLPKPFDDFIIEASKDELEIELTCGPCQKQYITIRDK